MSLIGGVPEMICLSLAVPLVSALVFMLVRKPDWVARLNLASSLITAGLLFDLVRRVVVEGAFQQGLFLIDSLSAIFLLILGFLLISVSLYSLDFMRFEWSSGHVATRLISRYYALLQLFMMSMVLVVVVENLGLLWVAIEFTTLISALLVAYYSNRSSLEAAWKYVMVCSVGITLALLGTILLYYAQVQAGALTDQPLSWGDLRNEAAWLNPSLVRLAFGFILIGYGTKAGLAPMHTWLPDAYSQAPSPISGILSGALMSCAIYALARNVAIINLIPAVSGTGSQLLTAFGVFSIGVAIPFLLLQHNVKRLLAYSSIENTGLIVIGLGSGLTLGVYGALLHVLNHAVGKSALFFVTGLVVQQYRTKYILRIKGLLTAMPKVGALFIVFLTALSGLPPFGLFVSKLMIIRSLFRDGWGLGLFTLLLLAAVFAGLFYYLIRMAFGRPPSITKSDSVSWGTGLAIGSSLLVLLVTGIYIPDWLDGLIRTAAAIVAGGK